MQDLGDTVQLPSLAKTAQTHIWSAGTAHCILQVDKHTGTHKSSETLRSQSVLPLAMFGSKSSQGRG